MQQYIMNKYASIAMVNFRYALLCRR